VIVAVNCSVLLLSCEVSAQGYWATTISNLRGLYANLTARLSVFLTLHKTS